MSPNDLPDLSKAAAPATANSKAEAVKRAAAKLGIDALDYATVISYETAGTFDPYQPGPRTKWGQHRGTIQYGEPQAKQYGVHQGQTFEDQVENSNVRYLRDAGVKPGDDLLTIYKAINGGSVKASGNASDGYGTISQHVQKMMNDHRAKAERFLGVAGASGIDNLPDLSKAAAPKSVNLPDLSKAAVLPSGVAVNYSGKPFVGTDTVSTDEQKNYQSPTPNNPTALPAGNPATSIPSPPIMPAGRIAPDLAQQSDAPAGGQIPYPITSKVPETELLTREQLNAPAPTPKTFQGQKVVKLRPKTLPAPIAGAATGEITGEAATLGELTPEMIAAAEAAERKQPGTISERAYLDREYQHRWDSEVQSALDAETRTTAARQPTAKDYKRLDLTKSSGIEQNADGSIKYPNIPTGKLERHTIKSKNGKPPTAREIDEQIARNLYGEIGAEAVRAAERAGYYFLGTPLTQKQINALYDPRTRTYSISAARSELNDRIVRDFAQTRNPGTIDATVKQYEMELRDPGDTERGLQKKRRAEIEQHLAGQTDQRFDAKTGMQTSGGNATYSPEQAARIASEQVAGELEDATGNSLLRDQRLADQAAQMSTKEWLGSQAGNYLNSIASSAANTISGVGTIENAILQLSQYKPLAGDDNGKMQRVRGANADSATSAQKFGGYLKNYIDQEIPADPRLKNQFATELFQGAGSVAYFMLTGGISNAAGLSQKLSSAVSGSLMEVGSNYDSMTKRGLSSQEASVWAQAGIPIGASEAFGVGRQLDKLTAGMFSRSFGKFLIEAGKEAGEEAIQEFFQTTAGEQLLAVATSKDKSFAGRFTAFVDALPSSIKKGGRGALVGGILGGGLSAGTQAGGRAAQTLGNLGGKPKPQPDFEQLNDFGNQYQKPVPETAETLDAQRESMRSAESPRVAVLYTETADAPRTRQKGEMPVTLENGASLLVNQEKAKELGLETAAKVKEFVIENGVGALLGKAADIEDTTGDQPAVMTVDAATGNELVSSAVTPETREIQKELDAAQFPDQPIEQIETTADNVVKERQRQLKNEQTKPGKSSAPQAYSAPRAISLADERSSQKTDLPDLSSAAAQGTKSQTALASSDSLNNQDLQSNENAQINQQVTQNAQPETGLVANENAQVVGFKTEKGSTYTVNGQSTTRTKSYHPEHGKQDVGEKEPSTVTYYAENADALAELVGIEGADKKRVFVTQNANGEIYAVPSYLNEQAGKFGVTEKNQANPVKLTTVPKVGAQPVELWQPTTEKGFEQYQAYRGLHVGNKIAEMYKQGENVQANGEKAINTGQSDVSANVQAGAVSGEALPKAEKQSFEMTRDEYRLSEADRLELYNKTNQNSEADKSSTANYVKRLRSEPINAIYQRAHDINGSIHEARVSEAIAEGKTVPAEVLADYPDLAKADVVNDTSVSESANNGTNSPESIINQDLATGTKTENLPASEKSASISPKSTQTDASAEKTEDEKPHSFSSTQIEFTQAETAEIRRFARELIDETDVTEEDGFEKNPHVTVKYGIHSDAAAPIAAILKNKPAGAAYLGKTAVFPANEKNDYDVVIIPVTSPDLVKLNRAIGEQTTVTDTFPVYKPHITLAYVKAGTGKKYQGDARMEGVQIDFDKVIFSNRANERTEIALTPGASATAKPAAPTQSHAAIIAENNRALNLAFDELFGEKPLTETVAAPAQSATAQLADTFNELFADANENLSMARAAKPVRFDGFKQEIFDRLAPQFKAALTENFADGIDQDNLQAAALDLLGKLNRDFGVSPETIKKGLPYMSEFIADVRAGRETLGSNQPSASEPDNGEQTLNAAENDNPDNLGLDSFMEYVRSIGILPSAYQRLPNSERARLRKDYQETLQEKGQTDSKNTLAPAAETAQNNEQTETAVESENKDDADAQNLSRNDQDSDGVRSAGDGRGADQRDETEPSDRASREGGDGDLRVSDRPSERPDVDERRALRRESARTNEADQAGTRSGDRSSDRISYPSDAERELNRKRDYLAAAGSLAREGSWRKTAATNLDILELVKKLEQENRLATAEEQTLLVKFTGWGASEIANNLFPGTNYGSVSNRQIMPEYARDGWKDLATRAKDLFTPEELKTALQSTRNAHYTSEKIVRGIWDALTQFGFTSGKILEPGMGVGLFAVAAPKSVMEKSRYTGIERDKMTAAVAKQILQKQAVIEADFTKQKLPNDFFDVAIGNPPFSDDRITDDPAYKKHRFYLHDYFFAKSIDKVRPGGLLVFVTSKGTMDKGDQKMREYIAERADLLGAVRLPQTAFKQNAGTEVVTDVIFLRKRLEGEQIGGEKWIGRAEVDAGAEKTLVNEYFAAHPEMVLGTHALTGKMYRSNEYTVEPLDGDIEDHFKKAVEKLPVAVYAQIAKTDEIIKETAERDFDPKATKEGSLYVHDDGRLMRREFGSGAELSAAARISAKDEQFLKGYVGLRNALKTAQFDQLNDAADWQQSLTALETAYDAFVKKHGYISDFTVHERTVIDEDGKETIVASRRYKNQRLLNFDVESPLVEQLERITEDNRIVKSKMLTARTIKPPTTVEIKTLSDALAVSLDKLGTLNLAHVAELYSPVEKLTREQVIEELGDSVFELPSGEYQLNDEYLSGFVIDKLEEATAAAAVDPRFERNVAALSKVQPKPLEPANINVSLGAAWVPPEIVSKFAEEQLEMGAGAVSFNPLTNVWDVSGATGSGSRGRRSVAATWGTSDRSPQELLDAALNNQTVRVTVTIDKKTQLDPEATAAANEIVKKMRARFKSWIWTDAARAADLTARYNRQFNNIAPRAMSGEHLTLPGLSHVYKLHSHQKRAVWRVLQTGNTYLAHAVGAGKTLEMIVSGMEQRRLGLIRKPMYVVPNHMLKQFSSEFLEAYPLANILVADENNFDKQNRKRFVAQAALSDLDAVVITHSAFGKLRTKEATSAVVVGELVGQMQAIVNELAGSADRADQRTVKELEGRIEKIERKFGGKTNEDAKDDVVDFEDLGVDFLYVDEAHLFRKLDFVTNRQNIKGIDPNGSQRALDLLIKLRWLDAQRPGRSAVLASGTPVTNTLAELYSIQRYLDPNELEQSGIAHFDAWAQQFGEVAANFEMNAAGKYENIERFSKFANIPELMKRVRKFMDVLTLNQLKSLLDLPVIRGGNPEVVVVSATDDTTDYLKNELASRIEASRKWKPSKDQPFNPDPLINIITDGRLAAIDMRFINPRAKNDPGSKLNQMIDGIIANYKKHKNAEYKHKTSGEVDPVKGAAQIVFSAVGFGEQVAASRGFDAKKWLTMRLTAAGIPASEIAFMSDYKSTAAKEAMFAEMRSGTKKILVGSPQNMGTGVNVQKRLKVLHFLSPPWFPADVEQPDGRILRQGNQNDEIEIYRYATKGTYDSTAWSMIARKSKAIEQAMTGDDSQRSLEDVSESSQYEQASALAAGDERAIQLVGLAGDIERLTRLKEAHRQEQVELKRKRRWTVTEIETDKRSLAKIEKAAEAVGAFVSSLDFKAKTASGATLDKRVDIGNAIVDVWTAKFEDTEKAAINAKDGLTFLIDDLTIAGKHKVSITTTGKLTRLFINLGGIEKPITDFQTLDQTTAMDGQGVATRVYNALNSLAGDKRDAERLLAAKERELKQIDSKLGAPFAEESELYEKIADYSRLQAEMLDDAADGASPEKTEKPARIESEPAGQLEKSGEVQSWEDDGGNVLYKARTRSGEKSMDEVYGRAFGDLIGDARFTRNNYLLEVNAEASEILRRVAEDIEVRKNANRASIEPQFDGLFLVPARLAKTVARLRELAAEARNTIGYSIADADKLNALASELEAAGGAGKTANGKPTAIAYVFDDAVSHEEFHRAGFSIALGAALKERHARFEELANNENTRTAYDFYFKQFYQNKSFDKLTPAEKAVIVEEVAAWSITGRHEAIGLTEDQALDYLQLWLKSFGEKNQVNAAEAFAPFITPKLYEAIRQSTGSTAKSTAATDERTKVASDEPGASNSQRGEKPGGGTRAASPVDTPEPGEQSKLIATADNQIQSAATGEQGVRQTIESAERFGAVEPGKTANRLYAKKSRDLAVRAAQDEIERVGIDGAMSRALVSMNDRPSAEETAFKMETVNLLMKQALELADSNPDKANAKKDQAAEILARIAPEFTDYGQAISQLAKWTMLDPATVGQYVQKRRNQIGYATDLTLDEIKALQQKARDLADKDKRVKSLEAKNRRLQNKLDGTAPARKNRKRQAAKTASYLKDLRQNLESKESDLLSRLANKFKLAAENLTMARTAAENLQKARPVPTAADAELDEETFRDLVDYAQLLLLRKLKDGITVKAANQAINLVTGNALTGAQVKTVRVAALQEIRQERAKQLKRRLFDRFAADENNQDLSKDEINDLVERELLERKERQKIRLEHYRAVSEFERAREPKSAKTRTVKSTVADLMAKSDQDLIKAVDDLMRERRAAFLKRKGLENASAADQQTAIDQEKERLKAAAKSRAELTKRLKKLLPQAAKAPTPSAVFNEISKLGAERNLAVEVVRAALAVEQNVARGYNAVAQLIRDEFKLSAEKSAVAAKRAYQLFETARANVKAAREAKKQQVNQALTDAKRRKNAAHAALIREVRAATVKPVNLIAQLNGLAKGAMIANIGTQVTNAVQAFPQFTHEALLDAFETAVLQAKRKIGFAVPEDVLGKDARLLDAFLVLPYMVQTRRQLAADILADFPAEYEELFRQYNADLPQQATGSFQKFLSEARTGSPVTGLKNLAATGIEKAQWLYGKLAKFQGAELQEFHFRSAAFSAEVVRLARARGIDPLALTKDNKQKEIPADIIKAAVAKALRLTYAAPVDQGIEKTNLGEFLRASEKLSNSIPFFVNPVLFAKFFYHSTKFVFDAHSLGVTDALVKGKYDARSAAKGAVGLGFILFGALLDAALGGDDDDWKTLKINGVYVDVSKYNPFAAFLFTGHGINRMRAGKTFAKSPGDVLAAFANVRNNPEVWEYLGAWLEPSSPEKADNANRAGAKVAGQAVAAFLRPLKALEDLSAQFFESDRALTDNADEPFLTEIRKVIPQDALLFGAGKKRTDPFTKKPIMRETPGLGILGVTTKPAGDVRAPKTDAEEYADKLRREDLGVKNMTDADRAKYRVKAGLKAAARRGEDIAARVAELVSAGEMADEEANRLLSDAKLTPLQEDFKWMPKDKGELVYARASAAEKLQLDKMRDLKDARTRDDDEADSLREEKAAKTIADKIKAAPMRTAIEMTRQNMTADNRRELLVVLSKKAGTEAARKKLLPDELESLKTLGIVVSPGLLNRPVQPKRTNKYAPRTPSGVTILPAPQ